MSIEPSRIVDFFNRFDRAFATFDGARVAALYHVPHVALRGDGSVDCITHREGVAGFFQRALDDYQAGGCRRCTHRNLRVVALGERSIVAAVTWELLDDSGAIRRTWRQSYNLIDVAGSLQVLTSTEHIGWTPAEDVEP